MAEIVTAAAVEAAVEAAEPLLARVRRQCEYVIFTNSYVGQLKDELEKLDNLKQRVQHSVDEALKDMKLIEDDVEKWAKDAETVANEARGVLENDGRAKKTGFCGWLPNPKARHCLGRDARKTAQVIQALIPQGKFERVCYERPPPGHVPGASNVNLSAGDGGDIITDSRASIFQGIMKALDDEKLKVIGVYGPGGVGKTTLLEDVEKKLRKKGRLFHMIVKAKVSQTPDLNDIQYQIADALGLNLKDKQSQQGRRDHLFQRLQRDPNEKVLIILDDLWTELNLKAVGIPLAEESIGCKLLLTSRDQSVLEQKMHANRTFRLEGLKEDEAFRLFEKMVGEKLKHQELKAKAAQVVTKLAGLPLLITSVASTLKCSDVYAWDDALIKIEDPNIDNIVRLSYDHLKSEDAQTLFLLCGLIGGTIQVELLLGLCMGLGLFEGFNYTVQHSRNRLNTMLDRLCFSCLLQDGGDDKENVTIHDLYSEVVVSTPFRGQNSLMMNSNYGSWEKHEKCWAICITDVDFDRLAKLRTCRFLDLKILMLSQPKVLWWMTDDRRKVENCSRLLDFTEMKELQVLYLCSMHITTLPSSIEILKNLRSLYLDNCDVGDVAILGKLKALQILSFAGSTISKLPKEIGDLMNLISLNLSKCHKLETIEPGILKGLINLEELHLQGSFDQWMDNDEIRSKSCNARLAELKSLKRMASLEISINDPTILLEDDYRSFENLSRFWINIGNLDSREFKGLRTLKLNLEGCNSILSKEWVQKTLQKTQYLNLNGLKELKRNTHELCIRGFSQLKHLDIGNSPSIKYIANSSNDLILTAFTTLESLFLKNLINLEKICHGPTTLECFSKLKTVSVQNCNRLKYLWRLSEMQGLVQLEDIEVEYCDSMQAIVIDDARNDKVTTDGIVELPNIRRLKFTKLPNMTNFCSGAEITSKGALIQVTFPNITTLVIEGLRCKELWNNQIPIDSFWKLEWFHLSDCDNLQRVAPSCMWKRLQSCLRSLYVISCRSIEIIYEGDDMDTENGKLSQLELHNLENLRHIWQSDGLPNVPFPNLTYIEVVRCNRLEMLFPTFTAKFLGRIDKLMVDSCENMEQIAGHEKCEEATSTTITFSNLRYLTLFELPKFKRFFLPEKYSPKFPRSYEDFPSLLELSIVNCGAEPNQVEMGPRMRVIVEQAVGLFKDALLPSDYPFNMKGGGEGFKSPPSQGGTGWGRVRFRSGF